MIAVTVLIFGVILFLAFADIPGTGIGDGPVGGGDSVVGSDQWLRGKWVANSRALLPGARGPWFFPYWMKSWSVNRCGNSFWGGYTITEDDFDNGVPVWMSDEWTEDDIGFDRIKTLHGVRAEHRNTPHQELCGHHFAHVVVDRDGFESAEFCYEPDDRGRVTGKGYGYFFPGLVEDDGETPINDVHPTPDRLIDPRTGLPYYEAGDDVIAAGMRLPRHFVGLFCADTVLCGDYE